MQKCMDYTNTLHISGFGPSCPESITPRLLSRDSMKSFGRNNVDGHLKLHLSGDRTQVHADIYPPRGAGRNVWAVDVVEQLAKLHALYGVRHAEIERAVELVAMTGTAETGVLVAQGDKPIDGRDGLVDWKLDEQLLRAPLPVRPDGLPDYFAYDQARLVRASDLLATVVPATRGRPGKT